jgi:hypothetical protein
MQPGWLIVAGGVAVATGTAFFLRTRLPSLAVLAILAVCGVGIAWGGTRLRPDPSALEVAVTAAVLAVLVPFHVRVVLGPFGPGR